MVIARYPFVFLRAIARLMPDRSILPTCIHLSCVLSMNKSSAYVSVQEFSSLAFHFNVRFTILIVPFSFQRPQSQSVVNCILLATTKFPTFKPIASAFCFGIQLLATLNHSWHLSALNPIAPNNGNYAPTT